MTLERIVPDGLAADDRMLREHVERYEIAALLVRPQEVVVDAACGVGYGTAMLGRVCRRAIGLDGAADAIDYARSRYGADNVEFAHADIEISPLPQCDVLVSFETIEHIKKQASFLRAARSKVRRMMLVSAPLGPTRHFNEFHLHDFCRQDIEEMAAPWQAVYFCNQSGSTLEITMGCWAFCKEPLAASERLEFLAMNLEHQHRQFERHHHEMQKMIAWAAELKRMLDGPPQAR